jgi:hypothetical protein
MWKMTTLTLLVLVTLISISQGIEFLIGSYLCVAVISLFFYVTKAMDR